MANNLDEELDLLKNEEKLLKILKKDMKSENKNNQNSPINNLLSQNNFENDLGFDTEMLEITEHLDEFQFSDFEGKLNKIELTPNISQNFKQNKRYNDVPIPPGKFRNKLIESDISGKFRNKLLDSDISVKTLNRKKLLYNTSTNSIINTPKKNINLLNSSKKQIFNTITTEEKKKNTEFLLTKKLTTPSNSKKIFTKISKK